MCCLGVPFIFLSSVVEVVQSLGLNGLKEFATHLTSMPTKQNLGAQC